MALNRDQLPNEINKNVIKLISILEIIYLSDHYFNDKDPDYYFRYTHEKKIVNIKSSLDIFIAGYFSDKKNRLNTWHKIILAMTNKSKQSTISTLAKIENDLNTFLTEEEFLQPFIFTITESLINEHKTYLNKVKQLKTFKTIDLKAIEKNIKMEASKLKKHLPINIQIINQVSIDINLAIKFLNLYNEIYGDLNEERKIKNEHLIKQQLPRLEKKAQAIKKQYQIENNISDSLSADALVAQNKNSTYSEALQNYLAIGNEIIKQNNSQPEIKSQNLQQVLLSLKNYICEQSWQVKFQLHPYYMNNSDGSKVRIPKNVAAQLQQLDAAIKTEDILEKESLFIQTVQIGLEAAKNNDNLFTRFFRSVPTKMYYSSFNEVDMNPELLNKP